MNAVRDARSIVGRAPAVDSTGYEAAISGPSDPNYLVFLREGPSLSLSDAQPVCEVLSRRFEGEMWTYGAYEADLRIGRFRLRVMKTTDRNRRLSYLAYMKASIRRARELARGERRKFVIISYDPFKNGLLASIVARITGGKFICEVNGSYANPDNFADEHGFMRRHFTPWAMRRLSRYVIHRADGVRLLFDGALEGLCRPRPSTIVRRYSNLAFVDRFYSQPEENYILLAGYPFYRKGADLLCRAFLQVADKFPDWKLVLIGHALEDEARRLGIAHERIVFHAAMPQSELAGWMARCAIFALPSRSEAMGRIFLEAAAAGKCRIGSDVEGIPTTITHDVDGVLVRNKDVGGLAHALKELMADPLRRATLGAAARRRAESEFSHENYLRNLTELVHSVSAATA